jgi:hypothetical protein
MPLFDYERMLFDTLQSNKHVWIKKATGLGVTEFMLRYMAWLCFSSSSKNRNFGHLKTTKQAHGKYKSGGNSSTEEEQKEQSQNGEHTQEYQDQDQDQEQEQKSMAGSQMCIVTGPRIELAITLIDRMKGLFRNNLLPTSMLFNSKETVIELNGVHIEAYPSHHLRNARPEGCIIHLSG